MAAGAATGAAQEWGQVLLDEQPLGAIAVDAHLNVLFATPAEISSTENPISRSSQANRPFSS